MPLNHYAHIARNKKACRLLAALEEHLSLTLHRTLDPYGSDAALIAGVADTLPQDGWNLLARRASILTPSPSTVQFVLYLLHQRIRMAERLTL